MGFTIHRTCIKTQAPAGVHRRSLVHCKIGVTDGSPGMRSLIKDELEPHMRDFSPSVVNGLFFERLSFGLVPMSIMGVRIVPLQAYSGSNVAIGEAAAPQKA